MLLKYIIALIAALVSFEIAVADSSNPVALLYERNPWLMVVGADSPVFVAYGTGQLIWWENTSPNSGGYRSVSLKSKEYSEFISRLNSVSSLKEYYSLSESSDQPTTELYLKQDDVRKRIVVYGSLALHEDRLKAPTAFLAIYDFMTRFTHTDSTEWNPDFIEVMVWPYEYAPDKSINWPKNWPDTRSETSRKRGDAFSIYLPFGHKQALIEFLNTRSEKAAVEINGKKWAISTRIPFPHEISR